MESRMKKQNALQLERVLHDTTDALGPGYADALTAHPDAVRVVLATTACVLFSKPWNKSRYNDADTETIRGEVERWINSSEAENPDAVRVELAEVGRVLFPEPCRKSHEDEADIETVGGEVDLRVALSESESRLSKRTRLDRMKNMLTSEQLAARVGLKTRQSVHNWLRKNKIVGWRGAKRGYVFPGDQLDDRDRPLKGLDRILPLFEDGYAAWVWLTMPRSSLDDEKPLTLLMRGESDHVVAAAEGDVQGDFA